MNIQRKHIRLIVVVGVSILLLSSLIYTAFILMENNQKDESIKSVDNSSSLTLMSDDEIDESILKKGYTKNQVKNMTQEQKDKVIMGIDYYYEDNKIRLYSANSKAVEFTGNVEERYEKYIKAMVAGQFSTVIDDVKSILKNYNLTKDDNLKLAAIYSDAVKMNEYLSLDKTAKEAILMGHHDPVGLVTDTLFAYVRRRESVILDTASATPVFEGTYSIEGYKTLDKNSEEFQKYVNKFPSIDIREIIRVDLNLPDVNGMYAIVIEATDGTLRIAGYYGDTAGTYLTVAERAEMGVDKE